MARYMNILASVALTTALTPVAANAATRPPLDDVHVATQQVSLRHVDYQVTVVQSGVTSNQRYPDSTGG